MQKIPIPPEILSVKSCPLQIDTYLTAFEQMHSEQAFLREKSHHHGSMISKSNQQKTRFVIGSASNSSFVQVHETNCLKQLPA